MAERVVQGSAAIAVELIRDGPNHLGAGGEGASGHGIHIIHIKKNAHRRAAQGHGAAGAALGEFVGEHDARIADLQFGVTDTAVGMRDAHQFLGAKGVFVEFDGAGRVGNDQVRRNAVVSLRDRSGSHRFLS